MTPFENEGSTTELETSAAPVESSDPAPVESSPESAAPVVEEDSQAPAAPAYQPNFKFKHAVFGKNTGAEKEFDDFIRPAIKDADTEKKVRELYEKAYGLKEFGEPRYQDLKTKYANIEQEHTGLVSELQTVGKAIQREDFGVLLEQFGIPEEKMLRWAANRVRYMTEMSPEERKRIDRERDLERQAIQGTDEVTQLRQAYTEQALTVRGMQLDHAISQPQVASVVEAVDAKLGQGAFRTEVIRMGAELSDQTGQDVPVELAVKAAVQKWSPFAASQSPAQPQTPAAPAQRAKPPVIPHMNGRSTSPAKKVVSSLDDLKKIANQASYEAE